VGKVLSFWGTGSGRHNGLNVTLTSPDGRLMEVQFPTPLSRQVGKMTHLLYQRVRTARFSPEQRIEALLSIISINHRYRMPEHQPDGLGELTRFARFTALETSFASWIRSRPHTWNRYLASMAAAGVSLESRLAAHNLPDDLLEQ
jgi:hypothetical protein